MPDLGLIKQVEQEDAGNGMGGSSRSSGNRAGCRAGAATISTRPRLLLAYSAA
jgi:hypothetical protein